MDKVKEILGKIRDYWADSIKYPDYPAIRKALIKEGYAPALVEFCLCQRYAQEDLHLSEEQFKTFAQWVKGLITQTQVENLKEVTEKLIIESAAWHKELLAQILTEVNNYEGVDANIAVLDEWIVPFQDDEPIEPESVRNVLRPLSIDSSLKFKLFKGLDTYELDEDKHAFLSVLLDVRSAVEFPDEFKKQQDAEKARLVPKPMVLPGPASRRSVKDADSEEGEEEADSQSNQDMGDLFERK